MLSSAQWFFIVVELKLKYSFCKMIHNTKNPLKYSISHNHGIYISSCEHGQCFLSLFIFLLQFRSMYAGVNTQLIVYDDILDLGSDCILHLETDVEGIL